MFTKFQDDAGQVAYCTEISNRPTQCPVCKRSVQMHPARPQRDREGEIVSFSYVCGGTTVTLYND